MDNNPQLHKYSHFKSLRTSHSQKDKDVHNSSDDNNDADGAYYRGLDTLTPHPWDRLTPTLLTDRRHNVSIRPVCTRTGRDLKERLEGSLVETPPLPSDSQCLHLSHTLTRRPTCQVPLPVRRPGRRNRNL